MVGSIPMVTLSKVKREPHLTLLTVLSLLVVRIGFDLVPEIESVRLSKFVVLAVPEAGLSKVGSEVKSKCEIEVASEC